MQDVPAVPRLAAGARVDEVEDALRSAGCAIVERVAPPDLLERIEAELAPYLASTVVRMQGAARGSTVLLAA